MFALVTKLLTTRLGLATLAGSGAAGVAYTTSSAARAEDLKDGVKDGAYFADTAENTINKAVGGVVALGGHVLSAATGETAQAGIRTAHDLTTKTLVGAREAAPAVGSAAYNAAAFTAETGISVAHAGYGGIYNFISEHILPKDASGWLKTLAAASVVGLGGAWVASSGKLGGVAQKLGEFIFGVPGKLIGAGSSLVYGGLSNIVLPVVGVLAIGFALYNHRAITDFISGGGQNLLASNGHELASPAHGQALAAATSTAHSVQPKNDIASVPNLNSVAFDSAITGGFDVSVANPVTLNTDLTHPLNRNRAGTLDTSIAGRTA